MDRDDQVQGAFSPTVNKQLNPELRKYLSKRSKNGFLSPTAASSRKVLGQPEEDVNYEAVLSDTDEQNLQKRTRSGEHATRGFAFARRLKAEQQKKEAQEMTFKPTLVAKNDKYLASQQHRQ